MERVRPVRTVSVRITAGPGWDAVRWCAETVNGSGCGSVSARARPSTASREPPLTALMMVQPAERSMSYTPGGRGVTAVSRSNSLSPMAACVAAASDMPAVTPR